MTFEEIQAVRRYLHQYRFYHTTTEENSYYLHTDGVEDFTTFIDRHMHNLRHGHTYKPRVLTQSIINPVLK